MSAPLTAVRLLSIVSWAVPQRSLERSLEVPLVRFALSLPASLHLYKFYTLCREMCVAHFYTFMATPNFYEPPTLCLHALSGLGKGVRS